MTARRPALTQPGGKAGRRRKIGLAVMIALAALWLAAASRVHVNASWSDEAWGYAAFPLFGEDRAELVTDDKAALREQLEAATGERIAALEAVEPERAKGRGTEPNAARDKVPSGDGSAQREPSGGAEMERSRAPRGIDRDLGM